MNDGPRTASGPPWAWRFAVRVVRWLLRDLLGWRLQARRPDVIPPPGQPLVVVLNHTSNVDAFLVVDTLWRRLRHWCRPLIKAELFELPVLGALARQTGAIPVHRGEGARREVAYEHAIAQLRAGETILIAPEGTHTHDGTLLPLRHGAARLALEAGVDMLVVTHFGAQRGFSPVVRVPERGVVVTMTVDLVSPLPEEDASSLTGRIAAIMLDRSAQLRETYPQADPSARWWPPYSAPASPSATARENLDRYRQSMADTVAQARERMAALAAEHEADQRLSHARERAEALAEDLATRSRARAETLAEHTRERFEDLAAQTRERASTFVGHLPTGDEDATSPDAAEGPGRPEDTEREP